jgi:PPK2 family polyphosphate:nucleotide phosphotransferase
VSAAGSDRWRVAPGGRPKLETIDAGATPGAPGARARTEAATAKLSERLAELQWQLYAEGRHSLLVLLQAMDAGGKDGTIRHVFQSANPQGVRVAAFKEPTAIELAHDFLWRVHAQAPAKGELVLFNRSHYEDVLVARVHRLVPRHVWRARFKQIRAFEELLAATGTTILKVFLHISREEQAVRLRQRVDDPTKRWKLQRSDLAERALWDDYRAAYEEAIERTTTDAAPWYVIPANHKWFRNWAVSRLVVDALERLDPRFPAAEPGIEDIDIR